MRRWFHNCRANSREWHAVRVQVSASSRPSTMGASHRAWCMRHFTVVILSLTLLASFSVVHASAPSAADQACRDRGFNLTRPQLAAAMGVSAASEATWCSTTGCEAILEQLRPALRAAYMDCPLRTAAFLAVRGCAALNFTGCVFTFCLFFLFLFLACGSIPFTAASEARDSCHDVRSGLAERCVESPQYLTVYLDAPLAASCSNLSTTALACFTCCPSTSVTLAEQMPASRQPFPLPSQATPAVPVTSAIAVPTELRP